MIDLSTLPLYDELRRRVSERRGYIVSLTDGTTTWYLSDQVFLLSDLEEPTLALLISVSDIRESLDIMTRKWGVASSTIELSNASAFSPEAGSGEAGYNVRASDKFTDIYGQLVEIYIYPGAAITALSDCLKVFSGTVQEFLEVDGDMMAIEASSEPPSLRTPVPNLILSREDYPELPEASIGRLAPIIFGPNSESDYHNTQGLIPCEQITENKWLVANHKCIEVSAVWLFSDELDMWVKLYNASDYTINLDDNGTTTVALKVQHPKAHAYIPPDEAYIDNERTPRGLPALAVDHDETTGYELLTGDSPDYGEIAGTGGLILLWTKSYEGSDVNPTLIGRIIDQEAGISGEDDPDAVAIEYRFLFEPGFSNSSGKSIYFSPAYDLTNKDWIVCTDDAGPCDVEEPDGSDAFKIIPLDHAALSTLLSWSHAAIGINWHFGDGRNGHGDFGKPIGLRFTCEVAGGGGLPAGTKIGELKEIRLRIPFEFRSGKSGTMRHLKATKARSHRRFSQPWTPAKMAVECKGHTFGSWAGVGGRTVSTYYNLTTHYNDNPVYIIEELLRSVCGLTTEIDTANFDFVQTHLPNTGQDNPSARYGLAVPLISEDAYDERHDRRVEVKDIIQKICRQSPLAFYYSPVGKARIIDITGLSILYSPTIEILSGDIDEAAFTINKSALRDIHNRVTLNWMFRPHDGEYAKSTDADDDDSQAAFGGVIDGGEINLDYVNDSFVVTWLKRWLYADPTTPGVWPWATGDYHARFNSYPKFTVKFVTPGIKYGHLEIGDWIKFEHSKMDMRFKCLGETWEGKAFIIVEKYMNIDWVEFTAIDPLFFAV